MKRHVTSALVLLLCLPATLAVAQREVDSIPALKPEVQTADWAKDWWGKRHEEKLKEKDAMQQVDLLMIGDSITHGWENGGKKVWDHYYENRHALNLGFSGDRTEQVIWRLQHGEVDGISPKLAVIMIGTNNAGHREDKPEDIALGIKAILGELAQRLPETKCLLLAIFPRGTDASDKYRKINDATNKIIKGFADGKRVFFLDINDKFLDKDGVLSKSIMPDLLHPNEKGYEIWASAMEPMIRQLMGEK